MAINTNYIRPQSEVHQLLNITVSGGDSHGHACIIGAQYDLYRYGKEDLPGYKFGTETASIALQYDVDPSGLIDYIVDEKSIQIYGQDILAKVSDVAGNVTREGDSYTILKAPSEKFWAADYSTEASKSLVCPDYSVTIGDIIKTSTGKAKVVALIASDDNPVAFDKIKVSANIFDLESNADTLTDVQVCKSYTGVLDIPFEYIEDGDKVELNTTERSLTISGKGGTPISCRMLPGEGTVYVEFRVLVSYQYDSVDGILQFDSIDEVQEKLGAIDVNNELAYACYSALRSSDGVSVYAVRVTSNTPEAYLEAVKKTESNSKVYAFVPVTNDLECIERVVEFNDSMSTATVKKWRINMIGVDVSESSKVSYDNQGLPLQGNFYKQTSGTNKTTYLLQILESSVKNGFDVYQYSVGDIITLQDDQDQTEYIVKQILAENLIQLTAGPESTQELAEFSIRRSNSSTSHISYAKHVAAKFNSRRTVAVWCDGGKNDGVTINNVYLAAELAGLTSSVLPHQGLTNTEIKSIDQAPKMYSRYTQDQLDDVAAHGVLVVTQDTAATTPYIRHQLTTCPDKGILYSELSCTRNIDNISYGVADIVRYYVGRANVVDQALQHISNALVTYWNSQTSTVVDPLLGPALVNYDNYSIVQDPKAMDRVIINVDYYIPSPLNGISVYQMVYVASVTL